MVHVRMRQDWCTFSQLSYGKLLQPFKTLKNEINWANPAHSFQQSSFFPQDFLKNMTIQFPEFDKSCLNLPRRVVIANAVSISGRLTDSKIVLKKFMRSITADITVIIILFFFFSPLVTTTSLPQLDWSEKYINTKYNSSNCLEWHGLDE